MIYVSNIQKHYLKFKKTEEILYKFSSKLENQDKLFFPHNKFLDLNHDDFILFVKGV